MQKFCMDHFRTNKNRDKWLKVREIEALLLKHSGIIDIRDDLKATEEDENIISKAANSQKVKAKADSRGVNVNHIIGMEILPNNGRPARSEGFIMKQKLKLNRRIRLRKKKALDAEEKKQRAASRPEKLTRENQLTAKEKEKLEKDINTVPTGNNKKEPEVIEAEASQAMEALVEKVSTNVHVISSIVSNCLLTSQPLQRVLL